LQTRQAARWWHQADTDQVGVRKVLDADLAKTQQVNKKPKSPGFFLGHA
jgi:hypothetical protein